MIKFIYFVQWNLEKILNLTAALIALEFFQFLHKNPEFIQNLSFKIEIFIENSIQIRTLTQISSFNDDEV